MIRRPPRSTLSSSSAASDVYKRQVSTQSTGIAFAMVMSLRMLIACLLVGHSAGLMYDLIEPDLMPTCTSGCAKWSSLNGTIQSWWSKGVVPGEASNHCAQLALAPGLLHPTPVLDPTGAGSQGAFCFCDGTEEYAYCKSPLGRPEQINLQLAGPDVVVVSFVTFEATRPQSAPLARLARLGSGSVLLPGVTHTYTSPSGNRTYLFHFVKFSGLEPRTEYSYSVKSGGADTSWSTSYTFRAPYSSADGLATRVAIFGDMGVYAWNNMENLANDVSSKSIDAVVHMGDHCYNIGGSDDRRGDGYMQAYQPVLAHIPWIPVVGNHEFYDGDKLRRYLNQTEGTVIANPEAHPWLHNSVSTATSALGSLLSAGNHHGAGLHGSQPSGTSRFFSVDFGLIHFVALDLNMYNAVDTCGEACREAQLAWLKEDLAAANSNRDQVPWIVAMSHFPLYCSNCPSPGKEPGAWWNSEQCEFLGHDQTCQETNSGETAVGSGPGNSDMVPDFEPLFFDYGVDVYASGHIHDYEYLYPIYNNSVIHKSFNQPQGPVHLVTGQSAARRIKKMDA
eukprot:TRINITY_DN13341_c0_g1_i2.p1 TRINITY_DN13341_c0_g1~~TRINITY_DN13341_c0_g1_i2.p1  ORF type:complete len:562 (-),score=46.84 TRINITY_DN13341_c0_g1_i2:35-1720(-)